MKTITRVAAVTLLWGLSLSLPAHSETLAFVGNVFSDDVSVIDTATNLVISTIPVGDAPAHLGVSPDGSTVYVSNLYDGTISVIDVASKAVVATILSGPSPRDIAFAPDGSTAYVANFVNPGTVTVLDLVSNTIAATIPVGALPIGAAVTPDGAKVYVPNNGSNSVSVIDVTTNTVTTTVPVGFCTNDVQITPDGAKAYVSNSCSDNLSVIDTATDTVTELIPVAGFPYDIAFTSDGSIAYVSHEAGTVLVIDVASDTEITRITAGLQTRGVSITPDDSTVYATNTNSDDVTVIDTATNTVIATITVGDAPYGIVSTQADQPPTADAGVDQSVAVGTTVALSGASSSDDNTPTAALDFAWSFVSKPAGSEATIANPALGSTSFLADMPGDYVVQLIVTDNLGQDSAADEMQVAANIDPAFVFERLTTGGSEYVYTYDYADGSYASTSSGDYHYDPFLREGNVAATRHEYDYSYNTATGVYEYNSTTSVDLLQSAQGAPTGTLVKTGETPIPGTSNAVFSYLYPRGFVDSKFVFNGSGCGEENGVRRCTGGEFERDLTAGAVVARGGVETPVPVDGAADPLTRVWRHYGGYYWYGRYLTNELWGGSDGRIVRTETYTYEYNSTLYTYTRRIQHRGIFTIDDTIDGGLATTVVDNEMQVPLAAPGTLFNYFGSAVIDSASGVTAFVGQWYDTTEARYRQGLFTADTFGTITRILDDNDPQWFRGWYTRIQVAGGYVYFSGYRYESGNLNGAWWSSYERGIYRSAGAGVEPVVTGKTQYFRDWESRDCGYVYTYLNTYHWYALPDGAVFNRSNYASDCAVGDYSSTNEGIVWRENGVDYPVVQTYNTEILGTTYRYVNFPWLFGQSVDGRTLAFNAGGNSPYSCTYDATENSQTCQWSSTRDTLLARFDSDRDGRGDDVDNCPLFPNPDQTDSDGNGIGDPCEDSDDDTVPDGLDNCPLDPNLDQLNSDADPYGNACDVCPNDTDDQSDIDGDGLGDACDPNSDADTINDEFDNCPFIANEDQANLDGDLLGDLCDPDVDGDGIANAIDGRWDGTTFTDQSAQSSRNFSDHDLGGISYGRVLQAANGTLIEDSPDPTRGVEINTVNSSGQTSIKQCDFVGREATLVVPQGTIKVLDCGSINLESLMNGGFLVLDGDIVIDVPTATAASVTDLGDGDFAVANTSETSLPIAMNLGGDVSVTVPSGSTGQVCEPEEGQYEIQNSPDSLEPIVAEVNGVTYVYEPGDIGVPVEVDILPESAENVVYIGRRGGAVDVAILSSAVFDAVQVDLATVSLSGASVKASRKNKAVADEKDVNGDGLIDLLFKVEAKDIGLEDDETAVLTAMTYGGVAVFGSDVITVVVTGGR